jgi:hypothetical protein
MPPKAPRLTWTQAGGPGTAPGRAGGGGSAITAPFGLGSGGGGDGDGGGGSSSARTTRSGPRPGHAPPARAPIGQRPLRRAAHWSMRLSRHPGVRGGGGTSCLRSLRRTRRPAETLVASDGRGVGELGPGLERPPGGSSRGATLFVGRMLCVPHLPVAASAQQDRSDLCAKAMRTEPGFESQPRRLRTPSPRLASVFLSGAVRRRGMGRGRRSSSSGYYSK